ncbi:MAG: phosphate/phosphite/phosphonate ABC transporter substrate-binding protein [Gammaproteobacteria bacterium SHHR-1]|uniref:phosphate/phosphite/phosphonate ABC transporter substrate-binding protein n=1 Tax=Magnetovirga frankeli TaxID=947516 RepID=UPI0012935DEB|nr:phosphate/phosphite/phosphonate ABC transporter substrate-binding protein [gamma proteobacterium SS-5]
MRPIALVVLLHCLLFAPRVWAQPPQPPLVLGFMPYLNAERLVEKYRPLADYLARQLGREVRIRVARDYAEHNQKVGRDLLDIAFLGGSPYVEVSADYGPKPLLARFVFAGKPSFRSVIFVASDSPLQGLAELRGKRLALGNIHSTLSSQVPVYMLEQAGVALDGLSGREHLRNHENVVLGVKYGDFDAGAVAEEVFEQYLRQGGIRALAYSQELSTHLFVTRKDLPLPTQLALREALLGLAEQAEAGPILSAIDPNLSGFAPVSDADYDPHRRILARVLPLLEP